MDTTQKHGLVTWAVPVHEDRWPRPPFRAPTNASRSPIFLTDEQVSQPPNGKPGDIWTTPKCGAIPQKYGSEATLGAEPLGGKS
jgi:hypothetical protein